MTGFGLEEEEQVSVFLGLVVVGEEAFLGVDVVEMAGDFILLEEFSYFVTECAESKTVYHTSSKAMRF